LQFCILWRPKENHRMLGIGYHYRRCHGYIILAAKNSAKYNPSCGTAINATTLPKLHAKQYGVKRSKTDFDISIALVPVIPASREPYIPVLLNQNSIMAVTIMDVFSVELVSRPPANSFTARCMISPNLIINFPKRQDSPITVPNTTAITTAGMFCISPMLLIPYKLHKLEDFGHVRGKFL
jgi:hypothetical protein